MTLCLKHVDLKHQQQNAPFNVTYLIGCLVIFTQIGKNYPYVSKGKKGKESICICLICHDSFPIFWSIREQRKKRNTFKEMKKKNQKVKPFIQKV